MNTIQKPKMADIIKIFIFAFLMMIAGSFALSDTLDPDKYAPTQDLPTAQREMPNLSSKSAKIAVDSDSNYLIEEKNSVGDNSNAALAANNDSSNENSSLTTEANADSSANTEQKNIKPGGKYVVTFNGFGSVKVGMTIAQASQALGAKLVRGKGYEDACFYVDPKGIQGVRFMVTNGKIARIDVSSNKYATDKGAKIGDTEAGIKSLYRGIKVYPNKYDEKKHDMEINSGDKKYLIIFETDGRRVTGFRVGNTEEVGYVEGCS